MKINLSIITVAVLCIFVSCDIVDTIEDAVSTEDAVEAMKDCTEAIAQFQAVAKASEDAIVTTEELAGRAQLKSIYPSISVEPNDFTTFPKKVVVDYGQEGIKGKDFITRKGKLNITIENGWYREIGSVQTTTFEDYFQDNYKVEGTHIVINTGKDKEDNLTFNVKVENGKVTDTDGDVIKYMEDNTRTWRKGYQTPFYIWDDICSLDVQQEGQSSNGVNYKLASQANEPLLIDLSCPYVKSGVLEVEVENSPKMIIDYFIDEDKDEEADCVKGATLIIDEIKYDI